VFVKQESGPISGKWYAEEGTDDPDHQPEQGKIDNTPEEGNKECTSV